MKLRTRFFLWSEQKAGKFTLTSFCQSLFLAFQIGTYTNKHLLKQFLNSHLAHLSSSSTANYIHTLRSTRNFSRLRRLTFLFMGNMSPYYFKTIFTLCMKCMPSFIKIGGAVSEKNDHIRQTFVVLYIGLP